MCQPLPFILGSETGGCHRTRMGCIAMGVRRAELCKEPAIVLRCTWIGFPKSLGNWRFGLIPSCCCDAPCPIPACLPAIPAIPAITGGISKSANAGGLAKGLSKAAVAQPLPFILGSETGGCPVLGWDVSPWAFGVQSCVRSLPLYFGAHGFGFPKSLGNWRFGLIPSCCC